MKSQKVNLSLANTPIGNYLQQTNPYHRDVDEYKIHSGYLFRCPAQKITPECVYLHPLKSNPGPYAYATEIIDHIRLDRKNTHLDGKPLTVDEMAAVNSAIDPWGQDWIRSGDNKNLFLPGNLYNSYGYALLYFPDAIWNGEKGDWDIVALKPEHHIGPSKEQQGSPGFSQQIGKKPS